MKKVLGIYSSPRPHWVGDGFPVRSLFSYDSLGQQASPSCCWTMQGRHSLRPRPGPVAWASIRTVALRR